MILIRPEGNNGAPADVLKITEEHLHEVALDIDERRNCLRNDPGLDASALNKLLADYRGVAQNCFKEANRLEEQRKRKAGIVHEYALDFSAARDEIWRRLARLRDAAGPGAISE